MKNLVILRLKIYCDLTQALTHLSKSAVFYLEAGIFLLDKGDEDSRGNI